MLSLFVPKESEPGEARVAATPETVKRLTQLGFAVKVESGAGLGAHWTDEQYREAGAQAAGESAWGEADYVAVVQPPPTGRAGSLRRGAVLVGFLHPVQNLALARALRDAGASACAMELVPRVTRAQPMDALSSQATVAGYKAALLAAAHLSKLCPLLMTAAGTLPPARAVVFGAGVAGLQAIATCRRLGAVVEATDVRLAAKEQVESLGARFIDVPGTGDLEGSGGYAREADPAFLQRQREEVAKRVKEADIVITTALVPGRPAPRLVSEEMVASMRPGSVVVDLAVASGGNCALSVLGETVVRHGVTIIGHPNLPATVPTHASELYSKNIASFLKLFFDKQGHLAPNWSDEILAGSCVTRGGEVLHAPTAEALRSQEGAS